MAGNAIAVLNDKERSKLLKSMTPDAQAVALACFDSMKKAAKGLVMVKYAIGKQARMMAANEGKFGSGVVDKLAQFLQIDGGSSALYGYMHVAEMFAEDFVKTESDKSLANGQYMTISHWVCLTRIADQADRLKMLEKTFREGLSAADLAMAIRSGEAGAGKAHSRQGGRKPNKPSSPMIGLQQISAIGTKLVRFEETAEKFVFDVLNEISADSVTDVMVDRAKKTLEVVSQAVTASTEMQEQLEATVARLEKVVAGKAEAAAEEYDEEAAPKKKKVKPTGAGAAESNGTVKKKKKKKKLAAA